MKKTNAQWFASVLLIITVTLAGTPLTGHAAPEVVAWGGNQYGQTNVPSGLSNVVGIAAGYYHSLALTAEGRVVAWGYNLSGQTNVPSGLGNVVAIAAGQTYSLALTADGWVVPWGKYTAYPNQTAPVDVPIGLSDVVGIAAGVNCSLALTADGRVVAWGKFTDQAYVPSGLSNVVAIAEGFYHKLALSGLPPGVAAPAWVGPRFLMAAANQPFHHRIMVRNGATAYGAAGLPPGLVLDPANGLITGQPAQAGTYAVVLSATNSVASCEWPVTLFVNRSAAPAISSSGLVLARLGGAFNYTVVAFNAPEWYGASGLPAGLVVNAQSGVISGVPVAVGDFEVSLVASNRYGLGTGSLTLRVSPVVAWGYNYNGETNVPGGLSNVVAVAAGGAWSSGAHSLALTAEGRVVSWSWGSQTIVPSGLSNVVAIAAGGGYSLALTGEGRVVGWGSTAVPIGLSNVVGIATGWHHCLALVGLPPGVAKPAWVGPQLLVGTVDRPFYHRIMARNGVTAYGAAGLPPGLALDPSTGLVTGQPAQTGKYPMTFSATNSMGSCEWRVTLFVNGHAAPAIATSGVVLAGLGSGFNYAVVAYNVPEWYGASGLPAGLVMDAPSGVIYGVPLEYGDFVVSLVVSNRSGLGMGSLTLRVSPAVAWGDNRYGQTTLPSGLSNAVAIAAGGLYSLALTAEGRVVAWGDNNYGQTTLPSGLRNVVGIAAGWYHSLALTADGRMVGWGAGSRGTSGDPHYGQATVPSGLSNVVAIAAGWYHSLALTATGQVVAWGRNADGQTTVPSGLSDVVAITAGGFYSLALTAAGRVVAWGDNNYGQTTLPSGLSNVVAIAAGDYHSLALTAEGRVVQWPRFPDVPSGLSNVVAIAAGINHILALTAEGRVVGWGENAYGQRDVPSGLSNVVGIAVGYGHSLALLRQPTVPTPRLELSRGLFGLELKAQGAPGISCQLLRASRLPGPWLPAEPVTFTNNVQWLRPPDTSELAQFFRLLRK